MMAKKIFICFQLLLICVTICNTANSQNIKCEALQNQRVRCTTGIINSTIESGDITAFAWEFIALIQPEKREFKKLYAMILHISSNQYQWLDIEEANFVIDGDLKKYTLQKGSTKHKDLIKEERGIMFWLANAKKLAESNVTKLKIDDDVFLLEKENRQNILKLLRKIQTLNL